MLKNRINTELSKLVDALDAKEEIKISEAARILEHSEHETEILAKKLAEYGIIELRYSLKGYKTIRKGPNSIKKETAGPLHKIHRVSPETEKLYNAIRQMSSEKRTKAADRFAADDNRDMGDFERQKRLREIREGLIAVRENLSKIRETLDSDLENKNASCPPKADAPLV